MYWGIPKVWPLGNDGLLPGAKLAESSDDAGHLSDERVIGEEIRIPILTHSRRKG